MEALGKIGEKIEKKWGLIWEKLRNKIKSKRKNEKFTENFLWKQFKFDDRRIEVDDGISKDHKHSIACMYVFALTHVWTYVLTSVS